MLLGKPVSLLVSIAVEPSQTHGLVLALSFSIASNTYLSPFTALSSSICIPSTPYSIPAYTRFWCQNLNGFHFFQRETLKGPLSAQSRLGFLNFCLHENYDANDKKIIIINNNSQKNKHYCLIKQTFLKSEP